MVEDVEIGQTPTNVNQSSPMSEGFLWHVRLGHASLNYLNQLKQIEKSLEKVDFDVSIRECEVCTLAKIERLPFKSEHWQAICPLQIIHADIMGKISPPRYSGRKVFSGGFMF